MRRYGVLAAMVLAASCSQDPEGTDGGGVDRDQGSSWDANLDATTDAPDAGLPLWESEYFCTIGGRRIALGMRYALGGNDCWCTLHDCRGFECGAVCTVAAPDGGVGTCTSTSGCGRGQCNFAPGCAPTEGVCSTVQSTCNASAPEPWDRDAGEPYMLYCGCDGVTYASDCPGVPYAHVGPCP